MDSKAEARRADWIRQQRGALKRLAVQLGKVVERSGPDCSQARELQIKIATIKAGLKDAQSG